MGEARVASGEMRRIIIVGLCGVGDLLFFLPTLRALRAKWPGAFVDLLVRPNGLSGLIEKRGLVDRVVIFPDTRWQAEGAGVPLKRLWRAILDLRQQRYDLSVWPYADTTFRKLVLDVLLGARWSVMHRGETVFSSRSWWPRRLVSAFNKSSHVVERNIDLVRVLGVEVTDRKIELPLTPEEVSWGKQYVQSLIGQRDVPLIGFHPGGNLGWCANRQWAPSAYAALADKLASEIGAKSLLFGVRSETQSLHRIAASMKSKPVIVTDLSLVQVASVIKHLNAVVGNDSALVHLAAALGVTALSVVGPTNPSRTGPWGPRGNVVRLDLPCSPCFDERFDLRCPHHLCLTGLSPEKVFSVLVHILKSSQVHGSLKPTIHNVCSQEVAGPSFQQFMVQRRSWESRSKASIIARETT